MNARERFIRMLEGKEVDRVPFTPRMDIWYGFHKNRHSLPEPYKNQTLEELVKELRVDASVRDGLVYRTVLDNIIIDEVKSEGTLEKYYITPIGTVTEKFILKPDDERAGIRALRSEHFIKSTKDYNIVKFIISNTRYIPAYDDYLEYEKRTGESGYPLCKIGDVPMNLILRDYIGYNNAYYELYDHLDLVEDLNHTMCLKFREMQDIVLDSPARLFLHGAHFDSNMTPPPIFDKYIAPYYTDFIQKLNNKNKWIASHQDADASLLLESYKKAGIHVADCFCCYPMVPCKLEDALKSWGNSIVIWGAIPSIILCPECFSDEEFERYLDNLFKLRGRGRIIPAISDNVMPESDISRISRIVDRLDNIYGKN